MKLIKTIAIEGGVLENIVLTESAYPDELRSRGRRAALSEGMRNPVWIYPRDKNGGEPESVQLLFADGRPTNYSIQP